MKKIFVSYTIAYLPKGLIILYEKTRINDVTYLTNLALHSHVQAYLVNAGVYAASTKKYYHCTLLVLSLY